MTVNKINTEMVNHLNLLRETAVAEEITATEALRRCFEKFPEVTRVEFKHSAVACGINQLTARNTFDRLTNSAE